MKAPLIIALSVMLVVLARGQSLYQSGTFPPGKVYTELDLPALVGQSFVDPAYLVGRFVFVGIQQGSYIISTFTETSDGVHFGKIVIGVHFFGNIPPTLAAGKLIRPTSDNPLVLRRVSDGGNGYIVVFSESWSAP
jgi:hypothetical protein